MRGKNVMAGSKGKRGPTAKGVARGAKSLNRKPVGLSTKSTYPFTKDKGLTGKGANRKLSGVDKAPTGKGKDPLAGRLF